MRPKTQLIIFDLDETLIHACQTAQAREPQLRLGDHAIYARPYAKILMAFCQQYFQVAIWTTATTDYAQPIIQQIFGDTHQFAFIWCRERCTFRGEDAYGELRWIKDLKKVRKKGWSLKQILVVEDKPENICRQYSNVIRIKPYTAEEDDLELKRLMLFLATLTQEENLRSIEKRGWQQRFHV